MARRLAHRKPRRKRFFARFLVLLVLLALLGYPFWEATRLTVEERAVSVQGLPDSLKNLRIVFLSDIHMGPGFSKERRDALFTRVNALSADLVLLGGDYAQDSDSAIAFFRDAPPLQARLGVFGVVGNHDRTMPESNFAQLTALMTGYGCMPLNNQVARVRVGKGDLYIAGVDDYYNGFPDVAGVAAQVRADDFVIFLGHTPDLLPDALKAGDRNGDPHWFDLALFGHTHGGQFTLLGHPLFRKLEPEVGARYLSGWYLENRAAILISNGVGTSGFPVRLFAPAQIHVITLKQAK